VKSQLKFLGVAIALACGTASAGVIQVGGTAAGSNGQVTSEPGVCTVNFNSGDATNACGATYTGNGVALAASHFRTGNAAGQYAAPVGDTSVFLTVGPTDGTPITIMLATPANYFGFFAGSLDDYNMVQFFMNGVMVDAFSGTDINSVAFPNTGANGSGNAYINYFPNALYNSIVYSSSANAFETDNHAFGLASLNGVPEPTSTALLGLGAIALLVGQRRRVRKS
jgi:hypothetical protein